MGENAGVERAEHRPVRLVVRDDLERSRLTVVFRIFLAIPLLVWVVLRGVAAFFVAFVNWLAVLVQGEAPESTHDFVASYIRYATQVSAYVFLAANPYPWFRVQQDYPIDVEIDPPVPQGRWGGFFRIVLALPALLLATALGGGFASGSSGQGSWTASSSGSEDAYWWNVSSVGGVAAAAALLAWFAILVRGGAPRGLRDLVAFTLGYAAQAGAYLFLLTPRYPTSDPELAEPYSVLPDHPVRMVVTDDLERPRLTVLFRLFLAIPHIVWILLWSVAVFFVVLVAWLAALITGRVPDPLHRFLSAYIRYGTHLGAFIYLIGRRFPGFTGRPGSYGIDVEIDPASMQSRWKTLFRFFLAIPAFILASALGGVALVIAFLAWWYSLATAQMPEGMRNLGASCLRYSAQTYAYALLVTSRYPYGGPILREREPVAATGDGTARLGLLLRAVLAALVFAALAVGAFLLYPTAVPDDLTLPALDVDAVFGADFVAEAKRYERVFYVLWVLAQVALLLTLWLYARRGAGLARESSAGPIGTGMLLGMLGLGIVWLVHLPFGFAAHWWTRRNEQSELSYVDWLFEDWALLGAQFLSICIALLVVMGLARRLGDWLVAPWRRRVRRHRLALHVRRALSRLHDEAAPGRGAPGRSSRVSVGARRRRHPDPRRGGEQRYRPGERLRVRARAVSPSRLLGHDAARPVLRGRAEGRPRTRARAPLAAASTRGSRLVRAVRDPRCVDSHANHARARRNGRARGRSARTARRRDLPARDGTAGEPHIAAYGGRGRLEGTPGDAGPRGARRTHARVLDTRARRSRPARLGAAHGRDAPRARRPCRDGARVRGAY